MLPEVRSFEHFTSLHLGMIAELPRKTWPAIARTVGVNDAQSFHHFLTQSPWEMGMLRQKRLALLKAVLRERAFILCIDETGVLMKRARRKKAPRPIMSLAHTSEIWARWRMALFRSMLPESWMRSPSP